MIQDARVLQDDFIPQEVEHRDSEVNALSRALQPIMDGDDAEVAFLTGPSGAGKTCIARFTLGRLRERVIDIDYEYVNCWQNYTRFRALYRILEGIDRALDIHRQSTPTDELLTRLREYEGPPYVVILDEVDQLQDMGLLYDLYSVSGVEMILIANRQEEVFAQLSSRLQSRLLSSRRVPFDKYSTQELVSILASRAQWGLYENAIERDVLERIADAAGGDARVAIGILRNAARDAEDLGAEQITAEIVTDVVSETRQEIRHTNVEKLTDEQQLIYEMICDRGESSTSDLYEAYEKQVDEPKTKRTIRKYLNKMCHYNLVEAEGEKRARMYRPVE